MCWQYVNGKTRIRQGIPDHVYSGEDGEKKAPWMIKKRLESYCHSSQVSSQRKIWMIHLMYHLKSLILHQKTRRSQKTEYSIRKRILLLNIAKSPGPDRVHPRVLKELAESISETLEKCLIWAYRPARCQRNRKLEKFRPYLERLTQDDQWITDPSASQVLSANFWSH